MTCLTISLLITVLAMISLNLTFIWIRLKQLTAENRSLNVKANLIFSAIDAAVQSEDWKKHYHSPLQTVNRGGTGETPVPPEPAPIAPVAKEPYVRKGRKHTEETKAKIKAAHAARMKKKRAEKAAAERFVQRLEKFKPNVDGGPLSSNKG